PSSRIHAQFSFCYKSLKCRATQEHCGGGLTNASADFIVPQTSRGCPRRRDTTAQRLKSKRMRLDAENRNGRTWAAVDRWPRVEEPSGQWLQRERDRTFVKNQGNH